MSSQGAKKQSSGHGYNQNRQNEEKDPSMCDDPLKSLWWVPRFYSGEKGCLKGGYYYKRMHTTSEPKSMQEFHMTGAKFLDKAASPTFPFFPFRSSAKAFGGVGRRPFKDHEFLPDPGYMNIMTNLRDTNVLCPCTPPAMHSQKAAILLGELYFEVCNAPSHYSDEDYRNYISHSESNLGVLESFIGCTAEKWANAPMRPWLQLNFGEIDWPEDHLEQMLKASTPKMLAVWEHDPFVMRRALQLNRWYHNKVLYSCDGYAYRTPDEVGWERRSGLRMANDSLPKDCLGLDFRPPFAELEHGDWKCLELEEDPKVLYPPKAPEIVVEVEEPKRVYPTYQGCPEIDPYFFSDEYLNHPRFKTDRAMARASNDTDRPRKHSRTEEPSGNCPSSSRDRHAGAVAPDYSIIEEISGENSSEQAQSTKTFASVHLSDEVGSRAVEMPSSKSGSEPDYEVVSAGEPGVMHPRGRRTTGMFKNALMTISAMLPAQKVEGNMRECDSRRDSKNSGEGSSDVNMEDAQTVIVGRSGTTGNRDSQSSSLAHMDTDEVIVINTDGSDDDKGGERRFANITF